ncbi:tetratricopeptide repeat domain protein [Treponema primitia ZAS-2]|uniref:Tetratricopeptide repeat domain protein n=1 Tax=Treponema primitia (strain ATCC BAA-887 / DSM 12427 / ZAS-2) TaxID=545694 RepID=F5YQ06_TREPZ|nr:tetratricopeptide repeat domain protein [Treponema primitia ZAS-2]
MRLATPALVGPTLVGKFPALLATQFPAHKRCRIFPVLIAFLLLSAAAAYGENSIALRLSPGAAIPLGDSVFVPGFGAAGLAEWAFSLKPQSRFFSGLRLGGGFFQIAVETGSPIVFTQGKLGLFFQWRALDRLSLWVEGNGGIFTYNYSWDDTADTRLRLGGSLGADFHLTPAIALYAAADYNWHSITPDSSLTTLGINLGVRLDLLELLRKETRVAGEKKTQESVFPVSYAWYENNPLASVRVTNQEPTAINDVQLSFYLERYMGQPTLFYTIPLLKPGESVEVPVTALFNEAMMDLTENITANASLRIDYRALSQVKQAELPLQMPIYHRNAMSWDDDRRAASFVSSQDPAAKFFARHVQSITDTRLRPFKGSPERIPRNIQYALGLFEALKVYGINYVIDPSSSYIELSENASSLDTLNYPYQTLYYRGGDCDDLSILFCSMLEVLGIDTAFITIPGHIYMAFDSGLTEEEGREQFFLPDDLIYQGGKAWVPLEITQTAAPFYQAWRTGAQEWRDAGSEGSFFPMQESWARYKPVSVSDAADKMPELPDEDSLIDAIEESLNIYAGFLIRPRTRELEGQIAASSSGIAMVRRNDLGGLYGKTGMLLNAETELSRIPSNAPVALNLGNIAFVRGHYDDAESLYRESLEREPENILARLGLARTCYEQGDYAGAEREYRYLQEANPELAEQYPYLGIWRETLGQPLSYSDRLVTTLWMDAQWQLETNRIAAEAAETEWLTEAEQTAVEQEEESPALAAFYRVVYGDSLVRIAQRGYIYGDWKQWRRIYEANKAAFPRRGDPDFILPGMILRIPSINGEKRSGTW